MCNVTLCVFRKVYVAICEEKKLKQFLSSSQMENLQQNLHVFYLFAI